MRIETYDAELINSDHIFIIYILLILSSCSLWPNKNNLRCENAENNFITNHCHN